MFSFILVVVIKKENVYPTNKELILSEDLLIEINMFTLFFLHINIK